MCQCVTSFLTGYLDTHSPDNRYTAQRSTDTRAGASKKYSSGSARHVINNKQGEQHAHTHAHNTYTQTHEVRNKTLERTKTSSKTGLSEPQAPFKFSAARCNLQTFRFLPRAYDGVAMNTFQRKCTSARPLHGTFTRNNSAALKCAATLSRLLISAYTQSFFSPLRHRVNTRHARDLRMKRLPGDNAGGRGLRAPSGADRLLTITITITARTGGD